jgi:hypothetical protein
MMEAQDFIPEEEENQEVTSNDILPDRDVLMMEKPIPDNSAAHYKPADKKLLRNIVIIVLFLIAALVILLIIVKNGTGGKAPGNPGQDTEIRGKTS